VTLPFSEFSTRENVLLLKLNLANLKEIKVVYKETYFPSIVLFLAYTLQRDIPKGYNNNIWWNIAHVVVTQQILVYKLAAQPIRVSQELVDKFKKGTVPNGKVTDEEIELIKKLLFTTIEDTIEDYEKELFDSYNEYAIAFNLFHEGLHLGTILSLQKAVKL